jgi:uncharacterized membrane protein YkoI
MKRKLLVFVGMLVLVIALGACTFHPPVEVSTNPQENNTPVVSSDISENQPQNSQRGVRPTNPAISLDAAIEIGYEELASRGHEGTFRNQSGMDWERGQWVWELEYRVDGGRLPFVEMYVNVDTGQIVKFEWDD